MFCWLTLYVLKFQKGFKKYFQLCEIVLLGRQLGNIDFLLCLDVQWSGIHHSYCRLLSALQSGQVLRDRDNLHPGGGGYFFTVMKLR
jgi:hypothetical protein